MYYVDLLHNFIHYINFNSSEVEFVYKDIDKCYRKESILMQKVFLRTKCSRKSNISYSTSSWQVISYGKLKCK